MPRSEAGGEAKEAGPGGELWPRSEVQTKEGEVSNFKTKTEGHKAWFVKDNFTLKLISLCIIICQEKADKRKDGARDGRG